MPQTPPFSYPRRAHGLTAAFLLVVVFALLLGSGCSRRQPTATAQDAFVRRKTAEARDALTLEPPVIDVALEAALDALAIDPDAVYARLALADAYYLQKEYKKSLKALKPLERREIVPVEVQYRKARALYMFHTYWSRGNYAKARRAAESCLKQGDKYLVECYRIIRNSYLGEIKGRESRVRPAYEKAAASARQLLERLDTSDPAYGDTCLVLAEIYILHLDQPGTGRRYLQQARDAAADFEALEGRIAQFEREQELRELLAARRGEEVKVSQ